MKLVIIITLSIMVLLSVLTIFNESIRTSVILQGVLSSLAAFTFLIFIAPDVALAEAVIGSTLSTIVILMAIRHMRVIHVVYNTKSLDSSLIEGLFQEIYGVGDHEYQLASNDESLQANIKNYPNSDFIICEEGDKLYLYSRREGSDYLQVKSNLEAYREWELVLVETDAKGDHL